MVEREECTKALRAAHAALALSDTQAGKRRRSHPPQRWQHAASHIHPQVPTVVVRTPHTHTRPHLPAHHTHTRQASPARTPHTHTHTAGLTCGQVSIVVLPTPTVPEPIPYPRGTRTHPQVSIVVLGSLAEAGESMAGELLKLLAGTFPRPFLDLSWNLLQASCSSSLQGRAGSRTAAPPRPFLDLS